MRRNIRREECRRQARAYRVLWNLTAYPLVDCMVHPLVISLRSSVDIASDLTIQVLCVLEFQNQSGYLIMFVMERVRFEEILGSLETDMGG